RIKLMYKIHLRKGFSAVRNRLETMMVNLSDFAERTISAREYAESLDDKNKDLVMGMYNEYKLHPESLEELKTLLEGCTLVIMSAAWCKDCKNALPVLMHLDEMLGVKMFFFTEIKTAPLDPDHHWKIPPSPPEMEEWGVTAIPWIEIFNSEGKRLGTIIEKPTVKPTLEEELVHVLKHK
ncbi:MAG: thioredoxin family protein, partial [Candidatus Hodarchaeota archaeon]